MNIVVGGNQENEGMAAAMVQGNKGCKGRYSFTCGLGEIQPWIFVAALFINANAIIGQRTQQFTRYWAALTIDDFAAQDTRRGKRKKGF